ncbi:MAG TPA: DinB family protein [Thermoanaerobaculia bacterium]
MTLDDIRSHFAYNEWANARLIGVMAPLIEERLQAPVVSSFPSALDTFNHIVAAEWVWLCRWKGENPTSFPDWVDHATFAFLQAKLTEVETERRAFLASLNEERLQSELQYRTLNGQEHLTRLLDLFLHVVNHSSYHRGQLTTILRQIGATPVSTDIIIYRRELQTRSS